MKNHIWVINMRMIIFGATGLVGTHMVNKFKDSYELLAVGRNEKRLNKLHKIGVNTLKFDITSDYDNYSVFDEYNDCVVINCAAAVTGASENTLNDVNILGTEKIIRKVNELNARLIHISSYTIYGVNGSDYTEVDKFDGGTKYAESKYIAEKLVIDNCDKWTIFRPPFIGGPFDENVLYNFSERIKKHRMPLIGDGYLTYIDARDIANITEIVLTDDRSVKQIYNIAGETIKLSEFIDLLGGLLGVEKPYGKRYPYFLIFSIGSILDFIARIRGKNNENSISRYRIKSLTSDRTLNTEKVITQFKFKPVYSIKQSIIDWINETSKS